MKFLGIVVFACLATVGSALLPKCMTGKLLQLDSCEKDEGTYKMGYQNITIDKVDNNKYLASGTVEVKEQVEGPITLTVYNCETKFDTGRCTAYTKWTTEGCKEMKEKKGTLYKMIKSAGGDDENCPLKPSQYVLKNYEIKIPESAAGVASTMGQTWYVKVTGVAKDDEVVLCTNLWLEIVDCEEPKRSYGKFGR